MDFHVLYEQICLSEQKAQERQSLLNDVKNDINNVQKEIRETKESGLLLKNQLSQKLKSLACEEENVLWYSRRQEMLQEKLDCMRKQVTEHHDHLVASQEYNRRARLKFMSEINGFSNSYDLGGKGQKERQAEAGKKLNALENQQKHLETDIALLEKQQATITKEEEKKVVLQKEIMQINAKVKSLKENYEKQKSKTKRLETAKTQVANIPNTDPEFQRLRSELESCQDDTMQGVCQALQQELDRLQRQRWQQQVQQRQRQVPPQMKATSLRPYQNNNNKPPAGEHQPFRVNVSDEKSPHTLTAKLKPNLSRLRQSMEKQNTNPKQRQRPSTSNTSSSCTPPQAKQMKKVRFENTKWE